MSWTAMLERQTKYAYGSAGILMDAVREDELAWSPPLPEGAESTGFMTMGQLLWHLGESCGKLMSWFVKDNWPDGGEGNPDAANLGAVATIAEAKERLEADRGVADGAIAEAGETRMNEERVMAPWGIEGSLGEQLLDCVKHLDSHKTQLFYYLKLLGRPVHTGHLWGLEG